MTGFSLQRQLIKTTLISSVVVGMSLLIVVLGTSFWQNVQWQDELMEDSAELILTVDFADQAQRKQFDQMQGVMQEFELHYQLRYEGWTLNDYELHDIFLKQELRFKQQDDMYNIWQDGRFWRIYVAEHNGLSIVMAQPWNARTDLLKMPFIYGMLLCFGLWIGLGLLNWIFIQRALKPVEKVRREIQQRSIHDLSALTPPAWIEIQPMVDALNTLFKRLDASIQAEQRFTADASHELRTPLSALNMRLQLLLRKYGNDVVITNELQKMLNDIQRSRLLIENLLLLAKIDPKSMSELKLSECSIQFMLEQAISDLTPLTALKDVHISLNISQDVYIRADAALLPIAIKNLLENAIKYALNKSEVSISLELSSQPISSSKIQLKIANHTAHIDPKHVAHLTERFYRVKEQSEHLQQLGSGLGLSIASKILDLHEIDYSFHYHEQQQYFEVVLTGFKAINTA